MNPKKGICDVCNEVMKQTSYDFYCRKCGKKRSNKPTWRIA